MSGRLAMFGARADEAKYSGRVLAKIDAMTAAEDVGGLILEMRQAIRNDAITRDRTGEGTADLVLLIADRLVSLGVEIDGYEG
ncbi:MAG: hypothetical protein AB7G21_04505 [Dehalococcoidia bacterium]